MSEIAMYFNLFCNLIHFVQDARLKEVAKPTGNIGETTIH